MPITKEELVAALEAPETATLVLDTLKEKEYNVIPKKEYDSFLETERARIAAEKTRDIYNGLDNDISKESGLKKDGQEATYDFAKRAIRTFKEGKTALETKIQDLEKKIAEGSQDQTLKAQLEALQQKQSEYEKAIQEKDSLISKKDMDYAFDTSFERELRGIKINSAIDEDLRNTKIEVVQRQLRESATIENGKMVFHKDGKPILDDKMNVASLGYILAERLKPIIDTGIKQTGSGSSNPKPGQGSGGFERMTSLPGDIKTKMQLNDYMAALGYKNGSKERDEDYEKFSKNLPLK